MSLKAVGSIERMACGRTIRDACRRPGKAQCGGGFELSLIDPTGCRHAHFRGKGGLD